ncbi:hypothetical protein NDU88_001240 [Pleurodeles waltl]|uniref:Uncharacterized protein n=1 Tax=Pleurodeles waltl TaxID=8319 RepID=A0AAV7L8W3_PLEWA|nr:hypothetical protein NDU88_001240 [Pleurodeles waltl]
MEVGPAGQDGIGGGRGTVAPMTTVSYHPEVWVGRLMLRSRGEANTYVNQNMATPEVPRTLCLNCLGGRDPVPGRLGPWRGRESPSLPQDAGMTKTPGLQAVLSATLDLFSTQDYDDEPPP